MPLKTDGEQDEVDGSAALDDEVVVDQVDADPDAASDDAEDADADATGDGDQGDDAPVAAGEAEEIVVTIGDEADPADEDEKRAPEWVRDLRKSNRDKDRRIRDLEAKLSAGSPAPAAVVVGEKPTLESCDFDPEKFEQALDAWHTRKREADEQARAREQADEQHRAQWMTRIDAVRTAASSLKVADYEDASQAFEDTFSLVQQGIVLGGPDDPKTAALLRYALGKNPKKAKELASMKDPVKFAFAVAKLESQLKITPRKSAPPPERQVRSAVAGAAAVDNQLARLQAEADKTGDRSKVAAFLRERNKVKQAA